MSTTLLSFIRDVASRGGRGGWTGQGKGVKETSKVEVAFSWGY